MSRWRQQQPPSDTTGTWPRPPALSARGPPRHAPQHRPNLPAYPARLHDHSGTRGENSFKATSVQETLVTEVCVGHGTIRWPKNETWP